MLSRRSNKAGHVHANTLGSWVKQWQVYPDQFCKLVCIEVMAEKGVNLVNHELKGPCGSCWAFEGGEDVTP